jgi:hypothetical protein
MRQDAAQLLLKSCFTQEASKCANERQQII